MEVEAAAVVPTVPETLLKKRKRDEEWASARKQQLEAARSKNAKNRQLIFKRAEQYIKEYRSQVRGNRCSIWIFVSLRLCLMCVRVSLFGIFWSIFIYSVVDCRLQNQHQSVSLSVCMLPYFGGF
jgi:hypothetical protein